MNTSKLIPIVPYPDFVKVNEGTLPCRLLKITADPFFTSCLSIIENQLENDNRIFSGSGETVALYTAVSVLHTDSFENEDSYALDVDDTGIRISSSFPAGIFYAFQTLRQLLKIYKNDLPLLEIKDISACKWRGFMIDTARSFFSVSFLEKMIDAASFYKMNRFHWHLTDDQGWRFPVPEYPELTKTGAWRHDHRLPEDMQPVCGGESKKGYYTEDEIKHLVQYASDRFVTVVPEIELPGHASALLASYPAFGCRTSDSSAFQKYCVEDRWGIFDAAVCPGKDNVIDFFDTVFNSVCSLFPGKWVHIGGDECKKDAWKQCPDCAARMKTNNLQNAEELQGWITAKIAALLESKGKVAIGWDEVIQEADKVAIPQTLVVQSWQGVAGARQAAALHHCVIMSPQTDGCYFDYKNCSDSNEPGRIGITTVKNAYDFTAAPDDTSYAPFVLGGECTLWTEAVNSSKMAEYMLFPRLCAFAEALWTKSSCKDFKRFAEALPAQKKILSAMDILYYQGKLN